MGMRHVKMCSPVGALLKKQKDENIALEIIHHWYTWAQEKTWKKKYDMERQQRIRDIAKRQKHLVDIFLGRTSRSMSNEKMRKVLTEWRQMIRESFYQRMFIAHLIKVRENVALSASACKVFYRFKEECAKLKHQREAAAAATRIQALENELAHIQGAWAEERSRVAHREHQLTACTAQWWRSEVLRGGWSAATCQNFLAGLEGPSPSEEDNPIAYMPARTPFSPVLQAEQAVQ